jgi:predicted nucleic acid-binding protein
MRPPVNNVWVVNASPVITLAKIECLHLLRDLCAELLIPEPVAAEILAGPPSDPARQALERGWEPTATVGPIAPELLEWGLGIGETAVLAVAIERGPATAVLDDAPARTCAKALGVEVIGTLGVVLRAKRKGVIPSAANLLKLLRAAGLWLDDSAIRTALEGVGETWTREN